MIYKLLMICKLIDGLKAKPVKVHNPNYQS